VSDARLVRRYGRVLRAYPSGPRRDELLDTLLAGASAAGRRRPTAAETADLIRHGLRARLGRPAGRWVVVVAVLVALTTGYAAAAFAARAAWNAVPGYPAGAALAEITGTVFPGRPVDGFRSADGLFVNVSQASPVERLLFGQDEDFSYATYEFGPAGGGYVPGAHRDWTNATVARLEASGWTVDDVRPTGNTSTATGGLEETGRAVRATRGDLSLRLDASTIANADRMPPGSFHTAASLTRLPPWYVTAAALTAWLLGAFGGWLLTGWASRRTEDAVPVARLTAQTTAALALIITLPQTLIGTVAMVREPLGLDAPLQPFWSFSLTYGYACVLLGFLLSLVAVAAAALAPRTTEDPITS
jgi:hypothetical protein